jgi:hypothetical protein
MWHRDAVEKVQMHGDDSNTLVLGTDAFDRKPKILNRVFTPPTFHHASQLLPLWDEW